MPQAHEVAESKKSPQGQKLGSEDERYFGSAGGKCLVQRRLN